MEVEFRGNADESQTPDSSPHKSKTPNLCLLVARWLLLEKHSSWKQVAQEKTTYQKSPHRWLKAFKKYDTTLLSAKWYSPFLPFIKVWLTTLTSQCFWGPGVKGEHVNQDLRCYMLSLSNRNKAPFANLIVLNLCLRSTCSVVNELI